MRHLAMAAVAVFVLAAPVRADEEKVPLDKVPKAVLEAAKKRFPKAEVAGASKEDAEGKTVYEIELKLNGKTIDVTLTPKGAIVLIEKEIDAKALPKSVSTALTKKYPKATYTIVEEVTAVKGGEESLDFYEVLLTTGDKKTVEVQVTPEGKIKNEEVKQEEKPQTKKPEKPSEKKPEKKEASQDVKLPKAVAEAVKSKFPGGKIAGVEKEDEDGETVYEVTLRYKAGTLEATLTPKGQIVKVELKGGEKDEDDDKNEKGKGKKDEDDNKGKNSKAKKAEGEKGDKGKGKKDEDDDKDEKGKAKKGDDEKGEKNQKGKNEDGEKNQKGKGNKNNEDSSGEEQISKVQDKAKAAKDDDAGWMKEFKVSKDNLASTGRNPYFVLESGYQLVLEGDNEKIVITVLDETKKVDGVDCRVVEERETKDGKLIEVSRNFFAIDKQTKNVYYFGEEVDIYKNDKVVGHEGAWLSGKDGAKFGLMMPGKPMLKARYYQEVAPGVALDRAEIVSLTESIKTPAGEFKNCVKTEETSPLEKGVKEYKLYAPDIGLVQEGSMKLVKYGKIEKKP